MKVTCASLTMLLVTVSSALVQGYSVEPVKASYSGHTDTVPPYNYVSQTVTVNFDLPITASLFCGTRGGDGQYNVGIYSYPGGTEELAYRHGAQPPRDHDWLNCSLTVAHPDSFIKGQQVEVRWTRSGPDSIHYYDNIGSAYPYGHMVVGGQDHNSLDLCMRVYALLDPVNPAYMGVDEWCFVPWSDTRGDERIALRDTQAWLADSCNAGTMMTYARWPTLRDSGDGLRHWEDFNARLWGIWHEAQARPVVNLIGVAKYVSTRYTIGDGTPPETTWTPYCAPRNLWADFSSDTNYWYNYVRDLLLHKEGDLVNRPDWPNDTPGKVIHMIEVWNEPNDYCTTGVVTGWWRRPNFFYHMDDSFSPGLRGLCELYVRLAHVTEQAVHTTTGHEHDTILIGATHCIFSGMEGRHAPGIDFIRNCYEIAKAPGGPGVFWDGVSFHPYQAGNGFNPDKFDSMAGAVRALASSFHHYDCQIWCTEVGVLDYDSGEVRLYHQKDAVRYLPRLYSTALASQARPGGGYDRCLWWRLSSLDSGNYYGLIGLKGVGNIYDTLATGAYWEPHESHLTFKRMTEELTGLRFEQRALVGDPAQDDSVRIYEFSDPGTGKRKWVCSVNDPTGRDTLEKDVRVPARTDTVWVESDYATTEVAAGADGWLDLTLSEHACYTTEASDTPSRPDLVVDSVKYVPADERPGPYSWLTAWITNCGNRATPVGVDPPQPYSTWVVFKRDAATVGEAEYSQVIEQNQQVSVGIEFEEERVGSRLYSARANPDQLYVERAGLDDNAGYFLKERAE